jgi:hypothetical protein
VQSKDKENAVVAAKKRNDNAITTESPQQMTLAKVLNSTQPTANHSLKVRCWIEICCGAVPLYRGERFTSQKLKIKA